MKAKFSIYDWREIMRSCGTFLTDATDHYALHFILLVFQNRLCTAYGADEHHAVRLQVACDAEPEPLSPVSVYLRPVKTPAGTWQVILSDEDPNALEVLFLGKNGEVLETAKQEDKPTVPVDVELFFRKTIDNLRDEKYSIAVNPKYLMDALGAMKSSKSVMLHFGTRFQPVMIVPTDVDISDPTVQAIVLPVRVF